jgi:hypothetical protein
MFEYVDRAFTFIVLVSAGDREYAVSCDHAAEQIAVPPGKGSEFRTVIRFRPVDNRRTCREQTDPEHNRHTEL